MSSDPLALIDFATDEKFHVLANVALFCENGDPTFRNEEGEFQDEEMRRMLQRHVMERNPEGTVRYLKRVRGDMFGNIEPNAGHYALVDLARIAGKSLVVATQNIDGLIQTAQAEGGIHGPHIPIHHLHGAWWRLKCHKCHVFASEMMAREIDPEMIEMGDHCECGGVIRPDVVLYGEPLDDEVYAAAEEFAEEADVCLLLGTSGEVYPAAWIPRIACEEGATLIEVNPGKTALSNLSQIRVREKTGVALPQIVEA
jgi:NAD-dependent deacetylase